MTKPSYPLPSPGTFLVVESIMEALRTEDRATIKAAIVGQFDDPVRVLELLLASLRLNVHLAGNLEEHSPLTAKDAIRTLVDMEVEVGLEEEHSDDNPQT